MRKTTTAIATMAFGAGLSVASATALAPAAEAADGQVGQRETVCAQTLALRTEPLGAWQGTLVQGQTFAVEQVNGSWVYGFAYGDINRKGWVQQGWFC